MTAVDRTPPMSDKIYVSIWRPPAAIPTLDECQTKTMTSTRASQESTNMADNILDNKREREREEERGEEMH